MKGRYAGVRCLTACMLLSAAGVSYNAYAQGPPITKQMQDTQRYAQKKTHQQKKPPPDQTKQQDDMKPKPASGTQ